MSLNRTLQPVIRSLDRLEVPSPCRLALPNGIPLHVLHAGHSGVIRLDVLVAGGRFHQDQPLQALFTNRMLREGTLRFTGTQIAEKLDYYGAWLELSSASEYAYITLYSLNKYLPQTLELLTSMLKEPLFPERELDVVLQANIQQFLVNSSKVDFLAHRALVNSLYGDGHPCGRLVQEADYRHITPDVLRSFYNRHYHSRNVTLYLSGDVTDEAVRQLEEQLGSAPFGKECLLSGQCSFRSVSSPERHLFIERADAMQSAVRMGMLTIPQTHPDYLKLRVLITLFGGYFGSRLMSNIREEKGYTYGISSTLISYPEQGLLAIHAETANEFVQPLIAEVYHEIERLQQELVPQEELRTVQNYMLGDLCRNYDSPFSLADAWVFVKVSGMSDSYFADTLEAIKSITPEEIRELAKDYLCKEKLKEIVVGKKCS